MKKTFIICACALLSVACNKEMMTPAEPGVQSQTFTAVREDFEAAKADLSDQKMIWELGDEISISDGSVQSVFVATKVDDQTGVATFSLKEGETPLAEGDVTYKAWFPAGIAPKEGVAAMPQQQATTNGPIPEDKNINYAPSKFSSLPMYCESSTTTLSFKNLCALIKVSLVNPGTSDIAVSQIILESDDKSTWGPYSIAEGKMTYSGEVADFGRAAVRNTNAKWMSVVPCYYFALPEGTYNSLEIIVQDNKKQTQIKSLQKALSVERNHIYNVDYTLNNLRTDLSYSRATANCYITSPGAKKYTFRATRGHETNIIPEIKSAQVLWVCQCNAKQEDADKLKGKIVSTASYDAKTGYIEFTTTNNQGNAVIAAYDGENCTGNIVWSWHIWQPSVAVTDQVYPSGAIVLDRNLGALNNTYTSESLSVHAAGFLYQQYRKDPFPGRAGNSNTPVVWAGVVTKEIDKTAGGVSVETAISHPYVYYAPSDNGIWCNDATKPTWDGEEKSLQDPCPAGYRVMSEKNISSTAVSQFPKYPEGSQYTGFGYILGEDKYAFYPITGSYGNKNGTIGNGNTLSRNFLREAKYLDISYNSTSPFATKAVGIKDLGPCTAYGMAVRCVKEQTEE